MAMKLIQFLVAFVLVAAFFIKPSDCGIFGLGALPLCLAGCEAARAGCIAGISMKFKQFICLYFDMFFLQASHLEEQDFYLLSPHVMPSMQDVFRCVTGSLHHHSDPKPLVVFN